MCIELGKNEQNHFILKRQVCNQQYKLLKLKIVKLIKELLKNETKKKYTANKAKKLLNTKEYPFYSS